MTTLYVDNIAPNLQSKISAPNLTLPSGSIVQVKHSIYSTWTTSTLATWGQTGLNCSITPTSTSNDILVSITTAGLYMQNSQDIIGFRLYKNGVFVADLDHACRHVTGGNGGNAAYTFRETASATTALNYQLYWRGNTAGSGYAIGINNYAGAFGINGGTKSSMTVMEIAG